MQCSFTRWQVPVPGTNLPSVILLLASNRNLGPSWVGVHHKSLQQGGFGEWRSQRLPAVHKADGRATAAPLCFCTCLHHPPPDIPLTLPGFLLLIHIFCLCHWLQRVYLTGEERNDNEITEHRWLPALAEGHCGWPGPLGPWAGVALAPRHSSCKAFLSKHRR